MVITLIATKTPQDIAMEELLITKKDFEALQAAIRNVKSQVKPLATSKVNCSESLLILICSFLRVSRGYKEQRTPGA